MQNNTGISNESRRVANNTLFLYFRMLLLLFIGLFTSRVILKTLGVEDYGTYNAVAGVVTMFTIITNAIGTAISRFITCELGKGDKAKLKEVFATSLTVQIFFCLLVLILVETLGVWFLNARMDIPDGRLGAANVVLQCSAGILMLNLLSVPFNAEILAHEHMKAFAFISIVEAVLKLAVALALSLSGFDKLKTYAVLMLAVAFIVRLCYSIYCEKNFEETRTKPAYRPALMKEMAGFAGWNALSSGVFVLNTQGLNVLTNLFFGVTANAARGVAAQVENIVKQFVNNVVIAINPQITKSYVAGNRERSWTLVSKASKYSVLIMLFFIVPTLAEADTILRLWLGNVPPQAALFTKLTLICAALDLLMTTCSTIVLADGRIGKFYAVVSAVSILVFPLVWVAFRAGAPASAAYTIFIAVYIVLDAVKLVLVHKTTGYPYQEFLTSVVTRVVLPAMLAFFAARIVVLSMPEPTVGRLFLTTAASTAALALGTYFSALTPGEKEFVKSKFRKK